MSTTRRRFALLGILAVVIAVAAVTGITRGNGSPPASGPSASAVAVRAADPVPAADPVAWTGVEWEPVDGAFETDGAPPFRVDGLVDGGQLIIGWGRAPMPGRNQFNDMGAVHLSADGRHWRTVTIEAGVNAVNASELRGVAVGPHGYLAYGGVCCQPESRAVWHSADAQSWSRLELTGDLEPSRTYLEAAVGTEAGWVAVGNGVDGTGGIWASREGSHWTSVVTVEGGPPGLVVADAAVRREGLIAVGTVSGPDGTYDGAVWLSEDGWNWRRVAEDDPTLSGADETQLNSVIAHANGLFVTGSVMSTEERELCEQLATAASIDAMRPVGISCAAGAERHWVSEDGAEWKPVKPDAVGGERPIEFRMVVAGGPGLVLLGESSGPDSSDTSLFTSPDGVRWKLVPPARPLGNGVAMALAARNRQVIAIADHFDGAQSAIRAWIGQVD